ncbi:MAG: hypothetical protein Q9192_002673 [Flavoplaca navasiana]
MSAATQKPLGELHPAVPTFSYAQAAKGRSPSGPSSVSMEKTPKEAETHVPKSAHVEDQDTTPTVDKSPTKRAVSEGGLTQTHGLDRKPLGETQSPVHGPSESSTTPATTTPATQASEKSQVVVSTPCSPEFGVTSSSTLLKDEDLFSNANASSDSTWEKLSQSSQNGSRPNDKVDQEKDITVNEYWDDETPTVPATAALKEAPPPPVNIWKQRAEAKAAKVPAKLSSSSQSAQVQLAVEANTAPTPFDIGAESRKHDSKKQTKRTHGGADEKSMAAGVKDAVKSIDEGVKGHEITDREPQRNSRAGQVDKPMSNLMPPPPPPGDAQSWPTPDSAQDEEKKKASGRMEKGEKEKAPSARAHGKEKWTPVPYVPTVQFSTPIPSVRRGMRAPRGGRESTPRGALNADKTTAGSPDASTGSQTAAIDHSKAEAGTSKNPTSTTKSKRASSAGPVSSRDSRKGGDMAAPEKRKDINASTKQTDHSTTEARRASASTQDDFIRNGGNHTNISGLMPQAANGKFTRTPAGINNRVDAVDGQGQPRPVGPERREGDFRGTHQARDHYPPISHRDRGEGRPDRGRGGYRSRGGSNNNLCKDLYLRKHMDSQGFVFLPVLAKFNRIRQLTQDLELIRYVCLNSPQIEFRTGSDGHDRLRKREGWQQWILSMEDRDPSVQNDGPNQVHQPYFQHYPVFNDTQYGLEDSQNTRPSINGNSPHRTSDTMVRSPVSASPSKPRANGNMGTDIPAQTPLSAAVPDFTPRLSATSNAEPTVSEPRQSMENTFTDEQVDLLMIVVRKPLITAAQMSPPFHTASSRTFSNGSIDGRTITSELTAHDESLFSPSVNGDGALDTSETRRTSRPLSPFPRDSPSRRTTGNVAPPVFWVKDKEIPIDSLPDDLTHEPYNVFRRNALMKRNITSSGACHYDMDILYQFWSHFLIRNFNSRMYQEFRATAFEDAEKRGSNVGLKNLVQYYNESILSQKVISDQIANDLLELVAREGRNPERPAFDKLRAAWRNGAFNMKNRKKLDSIMDISLKAELER